MKIRLGFANVVSFLALFVALSASSYAAIATVQANSVGTKQIKKGAVTRAKLATGSVDGSKVVQGSLTGADIQMLFVLEAAGARLEPYPNAVKYRDRMHARPAYKRGIERGGPYQLMSR